jgi:hypothetical protein
LQSTGSSSPLDPLVLLYLVAQRMERCQRSSSPELTLAIFDLASRLFDESACSEIGLFVVNKEPIKEQASYGKAIVAKKARDSAKRQTLMRDKELMGEYNATLALFRESPSCEDRLCKSLSWILTSDVPVPTTKLSLLLRFSATQQNKADDHLCCSISRLSTTCSAASNSSHRPGNGPLDRLLNFLQHS